MLESPLRQFDSAHILYSGFMVNALLTIVPLKTIRDFRQVDSLGREPITDMTNAIDTGNVAFGLEMKIWGSSPSRLPNFSGPLSAIADDLIVLLPRTSEAVACLCAKKLVQGGMITPKLIDMFIARQDRSSLVILSEDIGLSTEAMERLARSDQALIARAVAARHDLSDETIFLLLERNDTVIDQTLAEQAIGTLPDGALHALANRALKNASLAKQLLSRSDMPPYTRAALFVHAAPRPRMAILRMAEAFASTKPQLIIGSRLDVIRASIEAGNAVELTNHLSAALSIPYPVLYGLLGEGSGAFLALALLAVDAPEALVRTACMSTSFQSMGMPGGLEDVLETTNAPAARWIMAAHAMVAIAPQARSIDPGTAVEAVVRLSA